METKALLARSSISNTGCELKKAKQSDPWSHPNRRVLEVNIPRVSKGLKVCLWCPIYK